MENKFGERLKELRIEKGYSLKQLANEIGVGDSSICRWEHNQADITATYLIMLAKFFGVTTDYLLGLED